MIETYREVLKLSPCQPERLVVKRFTSKDYWSWRDFTSCAWLNANRPGVYARPREKRRCVVALAYLSCWSVRHAKQFHVIFSPPRTYPRTKNFSFHFVPPSPEPNALLFFSLENLGKSYVGNGNWRVDAPFTQDSLKRRGRQPSSYRYQHKKSAIDSTLLTEMFPFPSFDGPLDLFEISNFKESQICL